MSRTSSTTLLLLRPAPFGLVGLSCLLVAACAAKVPSSTSEETTIADSRSADHVRSPEDAHPVDVLLPDGLSGESYGLDEMDLGPCVPNPCIDPPPPECLDDAVTLVLHASWGTCTDMDGQVDCVYATTTVDCSRYGYLDGCRNGPCQGGCEDDCDTMVEVPEGLFWMGCDPGVSGGWDWDAQPYHQVFLDAYEIDRTEVTNEAYTHFLNMRSEPEDDDDDDWDSYYYPGLVHVEVTTGFWEAGDGYEDYPIVATWWSDANSFCKAAGKRLCTEAEWEKAARGEEGNLYPWGDDYPTCENTVMMNGFEGGCGTGDAWPVGSKPAGASPYGALDMAGNVWEWVADFFDEDYYSVSPAENPQGPATGTSHVLRGGGWDIFGPNGFPMCHRYEGSYLPGGECGFGLAVVGFRCCRSVP